MNLTHLVENGKMAAVLVPAADAGGRTGTAFSMKNYKRAFLICYIDQGNAATIALTPQQCTTVAGAGAKVINAVPIWACLDYATSDALARATDAANYTTDAGVKKKIVVFQIDADQLDIANSFDCIRLNTGASNAANITSCIAILEGPRYAGVTPATASAD